MSIDPTFLERFLLGGLLATVAVGVAFGPEIRRVLQRMRGRELASDPRPVSAEPAS